MATQASGKLVVGVILGLILLVSGGLVWYKNQPRSRVLPPIVRAESGVLILIPAGPFRHGKSLEPGVAPAFYIDETEVPNHVYARFCRETAHSLPEGFRQERPEEPVVNVSLADAMAFAKWAGKRLPDSLEWEKAARGPDGLVYPWGNEPDPAKANLLGPGVKAVSAFPAGSSRYRVFNMTGNVAEWVRNAEPPEPAGLQLLRQNGISFADNEPWYVVRGGSYRTGLSGAETWQKQVFPASYRAPDLGFRCARDPQR